MPIFRIPPLQLIWVCKLICCLPDPDPGPFLEISEQVREAALTAVRQQSTMLLVLQGVPVPPNAAGVFEVLAVRGERRMQLGSFAIVEHGEGRHAKQHGLQTVVLDITQAAENCWPNRSRRHCQLCAALPSKNPASPARSCVPARSLSTRLS